MGDALMQPGCAVVCDGKLITGEGPGAAVPFGLRLLETLKGSDVARTITDGIVLR